ncbi:uncharacterized protein LOC113853094 [Abrus precatorius]|uniref:Uncharacterized protein LOC113853094 n=1 Tax=Abrus precatorius TaxID=3816 RepID=A0A8B8K6M9_ABRPR|nr:uncharacterized protein LOC113853094 [Abrus precatorius]
MALKIQVIPPFFSNSPVALFTHKSKTRISCRGGDGISDAALASEFAAKAAKINAHLGQAEEAMKKSRKLLFGELCEYMGLREEEVQQKWSKMGEDEKWVLVKGFVADWGAHFHPLSARSTKEMLEEYVRQGQGNPPPNPPPPPFLFPGLSGIIGFP